MGNQSHAGVVSRQMLHLSRMNQLGSKGPESAAREAGGLGSTGSTVRGTGAFTGEGRTGAGGERQLTVVRSRCLSRSLRMLVPQVRSQVA